jgi:hypothetical protein
VRLTESMRQVRYRESDRAWKTETGIRLRTIDIETQDLRE